MLKVVRLFLAALIIFLAVGVMTLDEVSLALTRIERMVVSFLFGVAFFIVLFDEFMKVRWVQQVKVRWEQFQRHREMCKMFPEWKRREGGLKLKPPR